MNTRADRVIFYGTVLLAGLFIGTCMCSCSSPREAVAARLAFDVSCAMEDGHIDEREASIISTDLHEYGGSSGVPTWVTTAGTIGAALLASFLGIRTAKNGMANALETTRTLAESAHARLDTRETRNPIERKS